MNPAPCLRFLAFLFAAGVLFSGTVCAQRATPNAPKTPRQRVTPTWVMPPPQFIGGNIEHHVFESKAAGEKVSYLIYLPSDYEKKKSAGARYPVVYWLHGIGGSQQGVPGFCERLTRAIGEGKTPPMIVVFVNGMVDGFYCDAVKMRRPVESVIMQDLIPHIDATWCTIPSREGRAIEGFSMGGFGAAHLGFKYPEHFCAVSMIDAALIDLGTMKNRHTEIFQRVFGGEEKRFTDAHPLALAAQNVSKIKGRMVIRQMVGPLLAPNKNLHEKLTMLGIVHEYQVFESVPHSHRVIYDRLGDANWAFYKNAFAGAAPKRPPCGPSVGLSADISN